MMPKWPISACSIQGRAVSTRGAGNGIGFSGILRTDSTGADIEDCMHAESLRSAERRTLEMIADGASLKDVLTHLCDSIDVQVSPSVTSVLLMERDGKHLVLKLAREFQPNGYAHLDRCLSRQTLVCAALPRP